MGFDDGASAAGRAPTRRHCWHTFVTPCRSMSAGWTPGGWPGRSQHRMPGVGPSDHARYVDILAADPGETPPSRPRHAPLFGADPVEAARPRGLGSSTAVQSLGSPPTVCGPSPVRRSGCASYLDRGDVAGPTGLPDLSRATLSRATEITNAAASKITEPGSAR